jgi:hypothetical protein
LNPVRRLVPGIDDSGRSCIVDSGTPPMAKRQGCYRPGVLPPGHLDWTAIDHAACVDGREPAAARDKHYRDVVDLLLTISGSAPIRSARATASS